VTVYLSVKEVAQVLQKTQLAILQLVSSGKLPHVKINGELFFAEEDLQGIDTIEIHKPLKKKNKGVTYWMIPRSVRKWVTLQQMIKEDYKNGIIGGRWKKDRTLHKKRDKYSQQSGLRGKSIDGFIDENPGGARTDIALISALGLYYFDEEGCIQLTYQGEKMLTTSDPAGVLTEQMFEFRYPSPYSQSIHMSEEIHIFPYRFLFDLLMTEELVDDGTILDNDGIVRLTQAEIANFVIPIAKTEADIQLVVGSILKARESGVIDKPTELYNNIANTFINNIEITGFIERGKGSVWIKPELEIISRLTARIDKKPREIKYVIGKEIEFQQRFGMDPSKSKFSGRITTNRKGGEASILSILEEEFKNNPLTESRITNDLLEAVANSTGTDIEEVKRVVKKYVKSDLKDYFAEQYLVYATGGRTYARDFEITTTKIMQELLGKENVRWTGKEGKSPDIVLNIEGKVIIIDCKAESNYSIPNDHFNRMTVEDTGYIPVYQADFFLYVANQFSRSFVRNLHRVEQKTNTKGAGITAADLLYLLDEHRDIPFTKKELLTMFTSSTIVCNADINEVKIKKLGQMD